jgi:hypothetical protein
VTEPFERVARASALARGMSKLPIVVLPKEFDDMDDESIGALMFNRFVEAHDALVRGRV